MIKGKNGKLFFCICFFIICFLPFVLMPFVKTSTSENRELSSLPKLVDEEGFNTGYFDEITTYVAEHFTGRSTLISLENKMKLYLFRTAGDDQVVIGKDGWLFFDKTLEDYTGVNADKSNASEIAEHLKKVEDYIYSKGKTPVIMIVPNKNTIYPEYMPSKYGKEAEVKKLDLLQEELKTRNINYLDVKQILLEGKASDLLYLKKDTHWNNTGARLVINELLKSYNLDFSFELENYTIEKNHESDLSKILFPNEENLEDQRIYEKLFDFEYTTHTRSVDDLNISTVNENGNGKGILIYRDSFGRAMIDYVSQVFTNVTYNRSTPYDLTAIDKADCDYVVIEIVERNIDDLLEIEIPQ